MTEQLRGLHKEFALMTREELIEEYQHLREIIKVFARRPDTLSARIQRLEEELDALRASTAAKPQDRAPVRRPPVHPYVPDYSRPEGIEAMYR